MQLIVTPGFDAPQWLLAELPSCDVLFNKGTASAACGKVTFAGFPEQQRADGNQLPLPWNTVYQQAWDSFLTQLNARYGANPAFVAIAIGGPNGASPEIVLPTSANDDATQPSGLTVDATWAALIQHSFPANSSYQNSDQVFIDQWKQAIDAYEAIFTGVTLFLGPDGGSDLPNFSSTVIAHPDNTLFAQDCANSIGGQRNDLMPCEAKTEILSYFVTKAGTNPKSTQIGGLTASDPTTTGDIGMPGVRLLTSLAPPPATPFLGGAEFDHPVSGGNLQQEGCPKYPNVCANLAIEEAAYNVMAAFFYGTPAATFYGATLGTAPLTYLEVPYEDVQWAEMNLCPAQPSSIIGNLSLQDLFNRASRDLFAMAGRSTSLPPLTCTNPSATNQPAPTIGFVANAEGESPTIAPNTWVEIKGSNLAPVGDSRIWQTSDFIGNQLPKQLDHVSATVNGKSAYVYYISPGQINILTPPDAMSGPVKVVVSNNGQTTAPYFALVQTLSPSFFVFDATHVAGVHLNGTDIGPVTLAPGATPARLGETVALFANGFGPTSVAVAGGSETQSGTLAPLPAIQIGGIAAIVQFAGLVAPGEFQFNVVIPSPLANGDQPITTATYGGVSPRSRAHRSRSRIEPAYPTRVNLPPPIGPWA